MNRPTLCLITDRQRLLARRASGTAWPQLLLAQIRGALAGGVDVVQIRERGLADGEYAAFLDECSAVLRHGGGRLLVNDRLDLALAAGLDGVHLREESIPLEAARRLASGKFLIGRSVHAAETAVRARNADYMIAGSVFDTASKPDAPASLGLDGLRAVVNAAAGCPVWAVGGLTPARVDEVLACGVQGVAAIGAFIPEAATRDVAGAVRDLAVGFRHALDRSR